MQNEEEPEGSELNSEYQLFKTLAKLYTEGGESIENLYDEVLTGVDTFTDFAEEKAREVYGEGKKGLLNVKEEASSQISGVEGELFGSGYNIDPEATLEQEQINYNKYTADHLLDREGFRDYVYKDSLGKLTAGVGHLLTAEEKEKYPEGSEIPEELIKSWYKKDTKKSKAAALSQLEELGELKDPRNLQAALESVNFQMGVNWRTKFPTAWEHMKSGNWDGAEQEIRFTEEGSGTQSNWNLQTPTRVRDFVQALRHQDN
tara:strand:- start:9 stop:788 length:780 start_codon:yes stop_codon:yes gene_type:complete